MLGEWSGHRWAQPDSGSRLRPLKPDIGALAFTDAGERSTVLRIATAFDLPECLLRRAIAFEAVTLTKPPALPGVSDCHG